MRAFRDHSSAAAGFERSPSDAHADTVFSLSWLRDKLATEILLGTANEAMMSLLMPCRRTQPSASQCDRNVAMGQ